MAIVDTRIGAWEAFAGRATVCDVNQIRPETQVTLGNKISANDCCTTVTG